MTVTFLDQQSPAVRPPSAWRDLPPRIKALYITTRGRMGGWLAEAFAADSAVEVLLDEAIGSAAGLGRLRDEVFDAVLVSHEPDELDALDLVEGYRTGGADEPIVVLGTQSEQEMAALCYEVGADGYVCVHTTTTRNLIWIVARAIQRRQFVRENQHLKHTEQTRLQREHEEATRLIQEQWTTLEESSSGTPGAGGPTAEVRQWRIPLPAELIAHYRELLRVYVIMGSGNLSYELRRLAEMLVVAGLTARQTMQLHLQVLEELVHGLGARSTRHVMTRADLLALELIVHLAEGYRRRYQERTHPAVQRVLPGFDGNGSAGRFQRS
jgi:DNA-binding NarL/FixJ family response regulator